MGWKSKLSIPFARKVRKKMDRWVLHPVTTQEKQLQYLLDHVSKTQFGKDHKLYPGMDYAAFKAAVPIRNYESLKPYVESALEGKADVLWPGKPLYFSKTSGTTSGTKFIPISKESMPHHIKAARNALLCYIAETGQADFVDGKMIFLQGSPELTKKNGYHIGRLSGIVAHHVPGYLQKNRMPSHATNCIEDWETKVDAIVEETLPENMTLISGIPSWVQMYFERLHKRTEGKLIKDIFPNFSLFVYGGVNYEPYRAWFEQLMGKRVPSIELYPASEGFIAFQDSQTEPGLLLLLDGGIFYEFVPVEEVGNDNPTRLSIGEVELGVNYAIILNTDAGLWGYNIGDTVKFVSKDPYRLVVTGRIKHFISAFGEHVIGEEVEKAMRAAIAAEPAEVVEFTVAPQVNSEEGLPYHEWFVEFSKAPADLTAFSEVIDKELQQLNSYYRDLLEGNVLRPAVLTPIARDGFNNYMKTQGKLGGQNKVPRLSNDRKIADLLTKWKEI